MSQATAREPMARMIIGYRISRMVDAAAKLRIPDRLADGPQTAEELAQATGMPSAATCPARSGPWRS